MIDYDEEPFDLIWESTREEKEDGTIKIATRPVKILKKNPKDMRDFFKFIREQELGYRIFIKSPGAET